MGHRLAIYWRDEQYPDAFWRWGAVWRNYGDNITTKNKRQVILYLYSLVSVIYIYTHTEDEAYEGMSHI
jgi:hypothetical protein